MEKDILQRIAGYKRIEVEAFKKIVSPDAVREMALGDARPCLSLRQSVTSREVAVIAEHKRRSPSKGEISPMSDVSFVAETYAVNGAAAMSVLTDTRFFGGSLADLTVAKTTVPRLPLLRKDFILDEVQLYQARIAGADAVLLIAAMLDVDRLRSLNDEAHALGLETLVEIHDEDEIASLPGDADLVGINNRNLSTFSTDIDNSLRMIDRLPSGIPKIAESGIRTPSDLARLKNAGFDGFLIGEALMSAPAPGVALQDMIAGGL